MNQPTNSRWEKLKFDPSIYKTPYKISLFNPQNGEDKKRLWSQMAKTVFPHDQSDYLGRTLLVDNEKQDYFQQIFFGLAPSPLPIYEAQFFQPVLPVMVCQSESRSLVQNSRTTPR